VYGTRGTRAALTPLGVSGVQALTWAGQWGRWQVGAPRWGLGECGTGGARCRTGSRARCGTALAVPGASGGGGDPGRGCTSPQRPRRPCHGPGKISPRLRGRGGRTVRGALYATTRFFGHDRPGRGPATGAKGAAPPAPRPHAEVGRRTSQALSGRAEREGRDLSRAITESAYRPLPAGWSRWA